MILLKMGILQFNSKVRTTNEINNPKWTKSQILHKCVLDVFTNRYKLKQITKKASQSNH